MRYPYPVQVASLPFPIAQDVGFEPLLLLPKQPCYRYTTSCIKAAFAAERRFFLIFCNKFINCLLCTLYLLFYNYYTRNFIHCQVFDHSFLQYVFRPRLTNFYHLHQKPFFVFRFWLYTLDKNNESYSYCTDVSCHNNRNHTVELFFVSGQLLSNHYDVFLHDYANASPSSIIYNCG